MPQCNGSPGHRRLPPARRLVQEIKPVDRGLERLHEGVPLDTAVVQALEAAVDRLDLLREPTRGWQTAVPGGSIALRQ